MIPIRDFTLPESGRVLRLHDRRLFEPVLRDGISGGDGMKILFLDVDGVLTFDDGSGSLDPVKLTTLSDLVSRVPDLHICISSNLACYKSSSLAATHSSRPLPLQAPGLAAY